MSAASPGGKVEDTSGSPKISVSCPPGLEDHKCFDDDAEHNQLQPAYIGDSKSLQLPASPDSPEEIGSLLKAAAALQMEVDASHPLCESEYSFSQFDIDSSYPPFDTGAGYPPFNLDASYFRLRASTWPEDQYTHDIPWMHSMHVQVFDGSWGSLDPLGTAAPAGTRKRACRRKRMCMLNIASHLNELEGEDPNKVLILRRINRLGFESGSILKEHYERYGPVSKVLLSNAHTRQAGTPFPVRLRPSGIGYLLFEDAESAAKALAEGELQTVRNVEIFVRAFKGRQTEDEIHDAKGWNGEEGDDAKHRSSSDVTDVPQSENMDNSDDLASQASDQSTWAHRLRSSLP
jgi:hypothetical protein